MRVKAFRFAITTTALIIGILLVLALTLVGKRSYGPLEDFLVKVGSSIASIDNYVFSSGQSKERSKSLAWFDPYRKDIQMLREPKDFLLGVYDDDTKESYKPIISLEDSLKTSLPLIHLYVAWGSKPEHRFPILQAKAAYDLGSLPVVTWEPWLTEFEDENGSLRVREERDKAGLKDIAAGVYDFYLEKWARDIQMFEAPVFLRLGHEMNDPYRYPWGPHNNKPEDFIAAWHHVYNYFKSKEVKNIVWVWSPHPAYGYFDYYYPGDGYVDWVGIGVLNYGTVANWSQWWTFDEIFGKHYEDLSKHGKPVMISEFGCLDAGGDRSLWYSDAITDLPTRYPAVKAILFFHFSNDNTTTYKALNWQIRDDKRTTTAIIQSFSRWQNPVN